MLGEKIRSIRKKKNLTIIELAKMVDVTSGYVSQIERDLIDPSVSVLRRVSKVLDTPLSVLFSEDAQEDVITVTKGERTKLKFGYTNLEYEVLTPLIKNTEKPITVEVLVFKMEPKSWSGTEELSHQLAECVYVLSGVIEYHVGNDKYLIEKGDSIYIPEKHGHLLYNPSDEEAEAICIVSQNVY